MKLTELTINNYRCFEELTISFHPEVTILIAPNGAGKTTIIDAARIALWPFVKAFDLGSQTGKSATIQIEDVRLTRRDQNNMEAVIPASVNAKGTWFEQSDLKNWVQTREKLKARTNTLNDDQAKALTRYGEKLQSQIRDEEYNSNMDLPLIVYLGTGRLWYQGRYTSTVSDKELNNSMQSRLWGYQNCLTASSSYKQFEDWYVWVYKSYRELQIQQLESSRYFDESLMNQFQAVIDVVKQSVNALTKDVTGWCDIEYRISQQQQLVMSHPEQGSLPLSMLSDGLRNMVVMVSDIAFRCIKLNPHFGVNAALQTQGVVMIDEVDMFLHPSWQQTVISSLRQAFPKIQFIVTTHSPQVLSTVPKECIRVLGTNNEGKDIATIPLAASYGEPSNDVLQAIMHVDPQPPVPEKRQLDELTSLVDQGEYKSDRAKALLTELKSTLHLEHPQIQKIERSIRRQEAFKA